MKKFFSSIPVNASLAHCLRENQQSLVQIQSQSWMGCKSHQGGDTDFWAELNESYGQRERKVQHLGCRIWYKFRMLHSCAMLLPMTAAAVLPKSLGWWHSHPCSGIHWPFKVARNCLAGISGLELWFRENNRCTILEALKVLVQICIVPCLLQYQWHYRGIGNDCNRLPVLKCPCHMKTWFLLWPSLQKTAVLISTFWY